MLKFIEEKFKFDSRHFLIGGFWLGFAQAGTVLLSLVATVIFANALTSNDFGIYRYLIALSVFISTFSLTGVGHAILQAAAKGDSGFFKISISLTKQYNWLGRLAAILIAFYYWWQGNELLAAGAVAIAALQPVSLFFLNSLAYLQGINEFKTSTVVQLLKSFFVTLCSVGTLFITENVGWLFVMFLISQAIAGYFSLLYIGRRTKKIADLSLQQTVSYRSIAFHTSIRNAVIGSASRIEALLVFQLLGASSLALYTIAIMLPDQIKGSFKNLVTLLLAKFAPRTKSTNKLIGGRLRAMQVFLVLCMFSIVVIIITPYLYYFLFPTFPEAIFYTQILALSFPASASLVQLTWLQATGADAILYRYYIISSIILITATSLSLLFFNLIGVIIARVLMSYVQWFTLWLIQRTIV